MDTSATKLDQTAPAGKQTAGWRSMTVCAAAALLAALAVVCLMLNWRYTHLPSRERLLFGPLMAHAGQWGAGLGSREVTYGDSVLTAKTADGGAVEQGVPGLTEGVLSMPLLLLACLAAGWVAARLMKQAWGSTLALAALAACCCGLGLPVISGFLQGWGMAMECHVQYVTLISRIAKEAAPMMACGLVALSWVVVDHLWQEETARSAQAESAAFGRPARLWAATAAALVLAIILVIMSVRAIVFPEPADPTAGWQIARRIAAAATAGVSSALLLAALIRGRRPRWAWVGLCVLVPLGGEAGGGVALLLAALAARVPAVAGAAENRMPVKKMPVKKKRKYRL